MSTYRSFMSMELKRVKKMCPELPQKDVMRQAAANWQKHKMGKPMKKKRGSKVMKKKAVAKKY
jgi:hypothetical protein